MTAVAGKASRLRKETFVLALTLGLAAAASNAQADCRCICMSGHVQAICTGGSDSQPLCIPNTCPAPVPYLAPIKPLQLPHVSPPRPKSCTQSLVFNSLNGQYEWQTKCR
jgi:hypothetical protein